MTIENGWHSAKIMGYGLSGEPTRDKAQFAIGFKIVEGSAAGQSITFYGGFKSDAARDFTEKTLNKCGWNGDYEHPELTDAVVRILVETDEYNGKTRQQVKAVSDKSRGSGGAFKPMDPEAAKSFAAMLSGKTERPQQKPPAAWGKSGFGANAKHTAPREPGDDGYGDGRYDAYHDADDPAF